MNPMAAAAAEMARADLGTGRPASRMAFFSARFLRAQRRLDSSVRSRRSASDFGRFASAASHPNRRSAPLFLYLKRLQNWNAPLSHRVRRGWLLSGISCLSERWRLQMLRACFPE